MEFNISITILIIAITVVISLIGFSNREALGKLIFSPTQIGDHNEYYRFITSGFVHLDFTHLLFNMIVLWSFGTFVEEDIFRYYHPEGYKTLYILLYISALVVSDIPTYLKHRHNSGYLGLGASGAVSAVMFVSILFQPFGTIALYGFIKMPAIVWGVAYLAYEYFAGRRGRDNINHDAHLWGALYGLVFVVAIHPPIIIGFANKLSHFFQLIHS